MKITIAEGGPAGNVGSMALIENSISIVREKYKGCLITVMCAEPVTVTETLLKDGLSDNVLVIGELFNKPKRDKLHQFVWLIKTILWFLYSRLLLLFTKEISWAFTGESRRILKEIEESEYVYCIGAERINDIYYKTSLLALYCLGTYIKMGKKLVHMSLTIGPLFNRSTIYVAKRVMNKSYAIFVRDKKSYDVLREWKCQAEYQFNSYDIAIRQIIDERHVENLLKEFNLKPGFVAVSVIDWLFRNARGPARMPEYNNAHAEVLDYIVEKYNLDIVFTPTVICSGYKVQDTEAAEAVIKLMKHKDRVTAIRKVLTPIELATLYSQAKFGIVTRMHAAILCSGAGRRPVIAVNYLFKLREYMKNIGFEDYSVDIDYIDNNKLKDLVDAMIENYNSNCDRLHKVIEDMKKKQLNQIYRL